MNELLNTNDLIKWTGIGSVTKLKAFLRRMNVPFVQTTDTEIATTIESVQLAFNAQEVESHVETIKIADVLELCKISKASVYNYMKANTFPRPIALGKKLNGWKKAEIVQWLEGKRDW
ncbi:helix-turn-helix transcriptional regulator [Endozoicomonas ascidiicola]|uniref:helix-turn-helix transcriptional regulator n=1 Tax=Endozoicomonas ascidiicola TaxID=1698521 RepID=UPI000834DAB7|nr:AlpA family phage regulatory protein [Endozoicomonas ascidiicola]